MKKLNITKKQYDESRYFQRKYGKLKYVSESGKLFKTSKGKLLKFNEESVDRSDRWTKILREKYNCSWYHTNRLNVDIKWLIDNEEIGIHKGDVVSLPIKWWAQPEKESPKWNKALIDTVVYRVKDEYGIKYSKYGKDFVIADKEKFWRDNRKWWRETGKELAQQYKDITDRENRLKYSGWGMMESTKKFGKKFKESKDLVFCDNPPESKDPTVRKLAKRVLTSMKKMRKTLEENGIPSFSKEYVIPSSRDGKFRITLKAGRDDSFYSRGGGRVLKINAKGSHAYDWSIFIYADGWIKTPGLYSVSPDQISEAFNIFLKNFPKDLNEYLRYYEDDEYDESTKKSSMKSVKESIDSDPSFVCPYCGGTDCEFDYSEEVPNDDYFEGATLNAQFWCNTCDKPYNVTYELKVKDVYPNEDADSLDYDV